MQVQRRRLEVESSLLRYFSTLDYFRGAVAGVADPLLIGCSSEPRERQQVLTLRQVPSPQAYLKGWRGARAAIYEHALAILGGALNGQVGAVRAREVFRQFGVAAWLAEADAV